LGLGGSCLPTTMRAGLAQAKSSTTTQLGSAQPSTVSPGCMTVYDKKQKKHTSRRPKLPHLPISYPNRKAHRVTPGQTVVTPGVKSPRHSGSDASCFEVVANFESCY
jgi:hypothetical protein